MKLQVICFRNYFEPSKICDKNILHRLIELKTYLVTGLI
jgi:hypothetical protein